MNENVNVLIVENILTETIQLQSMLEKHHFKVTIATDGQNALGCLSKNAPDLVISNINIPKMRRF
jgi:CheY-like chemotaxis protein